MVNYITRAALVATAVGAIGGFATPAMAQATRTWVSGVGDDVNPCSRTAPCKTFAGAISKTAAGGEINCLDPGGFGAVSINKSMTISCPYTEGGVLAGGNGITVNDTTGPTPGASVVFLRGLDIFGVSPPTHGVRILSAGAVYIEDSVIRRFNAASSFGVSFQPPGATNLYINNVTIADNGSGATGGGILIQPTGASGSGKVTITNSRIYNNANQGIRIDSTANTNASGISVNIRETTINGNGSGIAAIASGTNPLGIMLTDSTIANNGGAGIVGNGAQVQMRVAFTTITGNVSGVTAAGSSVINTYGNNRLIGNPTVGAANNGAFSGAAIPTQ